MGLRELWNILEDVGEAKTLAAFRGKKLAVDISIWLTQCKTAVPLHYERALFFKILHLMRHGITPVFILDSAEAIQIKDRQRGAEFFKLSSQWEELLRTMGFPVMRASGEAEKACAQLNSYKFVDGVITDDGDAFAYGATTVLKNYNVKNKKVHVSVYEMSNIAEKLGLGQKEIIAAAILIACGYCKGVLAVGQMKFKKLVEELKRNDVKDILDRMRTWRTNPEILSLFEDKERLSTIKKEAHCSRCSHLGSIPTHAKNGCANCETSKECQKRVDSDTNVNPCSCDFHALENRIKPYSTEMEVCKNALKDPEFPNENVISEFLTKDEVLSNNNGNEFTMKKPNYARVTELLTDPFNMKKEDIQKFFPALVQMIMYGQVGDLEEVTPVGPLKKCKRNGEPYYLVKFQRFGFDNISAEDGYDIEILQSVFDSRFPDLSPKEEQKPKDEQKPKVEKDQKSSKASTSKSGKRKNDDAKQRKMTDHFNIKKKPRASAKDE